jgi:hypothetical protein
LIGTHQPIELEVAADLLSELGERITRQRFMEGRLVTPDGDGVMLGMLIATSRIQCVVEIA